MVCELLPRATEIGAHIIVWTGRHAACGIEYIAHSATMQRDEAFHRYVSCCRMHGRLARIVV
eukprot:4385683-Prymnesium_polylepis.3